MNSLKKLGIVGLTIVTVIGLSGAVFPARAQTVADLQVQISALLAQITALQSQLSGLDGGGGGGVSVSCSFSRDLTLEVSGDDVRCLQQYLNGAGHQLAASGVGSAGNETNFFGPLTKAAVSSWQAANSVSPTAGYFGPLSMAKYNSLAAAGSPGTVTPPVVGVPADGLLLRLSAGNPAAGVVPQGAAGVLYVEFEVAGNGTLSSLTFERTGLGQTNDFGSAYIYEGNSRLTSGKTINSTTHQVFFPNLNLSVSGVRTLMLLVDISASNAGASNVNAFKLITATGSPTPSGAPLMGNGMTFTGASVGTVIVNDGAAPSNPTIGQKGALLAEFTLNVGSSEDVDLGRIALTEGGTINNDHLTNLELRQGDTVLATASGLGAKDLVVFSLSNPFRVEKGQLKTFRIYGDVSGSARANDTIVFYMDSASDIDAVGRTYTYAVTPTISAFDSTGEADTLTVQGGQVTITFNGPVTGDLSLRGQDVTVFDFTLVSQNNIEIRNLRFSNAVLSLLGGYDDFKVWDVDAGSVVTSAVDVASTTASGAVNTTPVFTDTINVSAGEAKRFKVTVDVDSNSVDGDTLTVTLSSFDTNDIRNLDNNTFVALADIVGDNASGNQQTVRIPALDIQLSAQPVSQTYVQGSQNIDTVGFSLRAVADDIKVTSLKILASSSVGTLTSGELQNLKLFVDGAQIGPTKGLDNSLTATFDNLNYTISKGVTKVFTVKANINASATNADQYSVSINALDDITATDSEGNTLTIAANGLTGSTANSGNTVILTITTTGQLNVALAPDDVESEAGIILANNTAQVLAKFRWTAIDEAMTLNDFDLFVNDDNTSNTASSTPDEVAIVEIWAGGTKLGSYSVQGSGANMGQVLVRDLSGFTVDKDSSKIMTVKGVVNTIALGADTGNEVAVHILSSNFEAAGSTNLDTSLTGVSGNEKLVYKTKPTLSVAKLSGAILTTGAVKVMRLTVTADANEDVAWRKIQLFVALTDATMTGGTTSNVIVRDVSSQTNLTLTTVHSASSVTGTGANDITGGNTGYVSITLTAEQVISAGTSKEYDISLTFADVDAGGNGGQSVSANLHQQATAKIASNTQTLIEGTSDGVPSFIWSDWSDTSHSLTTTDWSNGYYVKSLPSDVITLIGG